MLAVGTSLQTYTISDFLQWSEEKFLTLNPDFQRREVWTSSARIYLIDTILRGLPIPKVFIRTKIDLKTRKSIREVVDGQQRLRAILDFANDKFALSNRAKEFKGYRYSTLPEELQEAFLSYEISVDQFVNASDSTVLEIFARINTYTASLRPAEMRHAKYQGEFKWTVREYAKKWEVLWDSIELISKRSRFRMEDDAVMAQMFGIHIDGVMSADDKYLESLYKLYLYDDDFTEASEIGKRVDESIDLILRNFRDVLVGPLASAPHFIMLYAAVGHAEFGIPSGVLGSDMPNRESDWLTDVETARDNLATLGSEIEMRNTNGRFGSFVLASLANAHRAPSRRIRLPVYCRALAPHPIRPS
jgi:hypothetical protein